MTTKDKSEGRLTAQRASFRLWTLGAGLVLGLAAIVSLPLVFGDLGGDRGAVNWLTIFVGTSAAASQFWRLLIARPRRIVAVSNEADPALLTAGSASTVLTWRRQRSAVETGEFTAEEGLPDGVSDPYQPKGRSLRCARDDRVCCSPGKDSSAYGRRSQ